MRRVLDLRFLLVVTALLLQFSVGETLNAAEPTLHPADVTMAVMQGSGCAGDECAAGDCQPRPCDMGVSPACHCSCAQIPSLATGEMTCVAYLPGAARASEIPGSAAPGRPENPFRPPA
jgi:hypothetical protein